MAEQLLLNFKTKPAYNAADFFVSTSNETAYKWIRLWPRWPDPLLCIYGPSGSGKTHLAHVWQEMTHADFYQFDTLQCRNLEDIFRHNPCMILDQVDWAPYEQLLFHLYNIARSCQGSILLVTPESPESWDVRLPDLRSRLNASPKCAMGPPDPDLQRALIHKFLADHQMTFSETIQAKMIACAPRSFTGMRAYISEIYRISLTAHPRMSISLLENLGRTHEFS